MQRTVLVTGASSGIGAATALALAGRWRVALVARRGPLLEEIAGRIRAGGGEAEPFPLDLVADGAPASAVAAAVRRFGGLDALVNNAGAYAQWGAEAHDDREFEGLWRLNVAVPMALVREALPHLRRRGGAIVNVSSVAAEASFSNCAAYAASKAGLDAWSRGLREELRGSGVRVGVVVPGATSSEIWGGQAPPPARLCRAEDVAEAIRFVLEQPATASVDRLVVAPPAGPL